MITVLMANDYPIACCARKNLPAALDAAVKELTARHVGCCIFFGGRQLVGGTGAHIYLRDYDVPFHSCASSTREAIDEFTDIL